MDQKENAASRASVDAVVLRPPMPDDDMPLTSEWLKEVCHCENREGLYGFDNDSFWFEIEDHGEDCFGFWMGGTEWDGERIKTRGNVRDVCWLIGCQWFSDCWGSP